MGMFDIKVEFELLIEPFLDEHPMVFRLGTGTGGQGNDLALH